MIQAFKATTETGSVYRCDGWFFWKNLGYKDRVWTLKAVEDLPNRELPWSVIHSSPDVEVPVVGKRLFISGGDLWFLSTRVVSVEPLDD